MKPYCTHLTQTSFKHLSLNDLDTYWAEGEKGRRELQQVMSGEVWMKREVTACSFVTCRSWTAASTDLPPESSLRMMLEHLWLKSLWSSENGLKEQMKWLIKSSTLRHLPLCGMFVCVRVCIQCVCDRGGRGYIRAGMCHQVSLWNLCERWV